MSGNSIAPKGPEHAHPESIPFPPYDATQEPIPLPDRLRLTDSQGRQVPHVGDPADWDDAGDGRSTAPMPPRNTAPTRPPPLVVGEGSKSSFVSIDHSRDVFETIWQPLGLWATLPREIPAQSFAMPLTHEGDIAYGVVKVGVWASVSAAIVYAVVTLEGAAASVVGALTPRSYWDSILSPPEPMS